LKGGAQLHEVGVAPLDLYDFIYFGHKIFPY